MSRQVALVIGASPGFGLLAAAGLLERGITVYAAARRLGPMQALADKGAHLLMMDVMDDVSVRAGVARIISEVGQIDIVLNNAGYGVFGAAEVVPIADAMRQFDINLFGLARVNNAVLPHMRARRSGRLILTSSLASHISPPGQGWYSATKHAVKGLAEAMRAELAPLGIHVVQIEPGPVRTDFEEVAFAQLDGLPHPADYQPLLTAFRRFMVKTYARSPGPEGTARAMIRAATARVPRAVYRTTFDAKLLPLVRGVLGAALFGKILSRVIMRESKRPPKP